MTLSAVTAVVLTYATHSAVACAFGFAIACRLRRPRDRDILWKTVFVAPWCTTAFALALATGLPRWPALNLSGLVRRVWMQPLPHRSVVLRIHKIADHTSISRTVTDPVDRTLSVVVLCIAALCVAIAAYGLVARYRTLSRRIADRRTLLRPSMDLDAPTRAEESTSVPAIIMTTCDELPSPIALGRNEICLPPAVAFDFDHARRAALIAHETAHLARRDPLWFATVDTIAALSAFQPLCRGAVRAFRHNAELVCDEMALRTTGDRVALIGALAALAAPFDDLIGAPAALSTNAPRPLLARAERIASVDLRASTTQPRVAWLIAIACLITLAAVPTVRPDPRDPPLTRHLPTLRPRMVTVDTMLTLRR